MNLFQGLKPAWIIHIFALLHLVTALLCRLYQVDDELLLTMLTMVMTLIVCQKKNLSIEFSASMIIVGNVIGYLLGTLNAKLLGLAFASPYIIQPLSTFITTEILGWSIVAVAETFKLGKSEDEKGSLASPYMKWLLLAAGVIFLIRIGVMLIFSNVNVDSDDIYVIVRNVLSNSVGLLILICLNILYVRFSDKKFGNKSKVAKTGILSTFVAAASLLETLIAGYGFPFTIFSGFNGSFVLIFIVSVLTQITVYCIVFIVNYALKAKGDMQKQRVRAHAAQYRYMKLKGQVNPHFLFNSLNILDCLVCEEKTEQASTYIHKLAGIYRYMIKSEEEELVKLSDELVFIGLYTDLLKVRFTEGLEVTMDVSEDCCNRMILPCSLQLLIENATKHNAASRDNPLKIRVEASGDSVRVINNIIPKITSSPSTGLGHKYISRQYLDLCGKSIEIDIADNNYCVTLPLL
jgi:sensor histidine kinase YesM